MRDGKATRKRIHDEALKLFVAKGVTETSVRDLAQAAGIAEGTLYRHYASKDELVSDLFLSNYREFAERLRSLEAPTPGLRAKLIAVSEYLYRFHDDNPTLFRFLMLVQHQGLPRVDRVGANPVAIIRTLIEEASHAGEISLDDIDLGLAMVLGLLLQPATALMYGRLDAPLARYATDIAAACWRVLNPAEVPDV